MGCNCGNKTVTMTWQYTAPNGAVSNYTSQVQARSAQIRNGGGIIVEKRSS